MLVLFIIVCIAAGIGAIEFSNKYNNKMFAISAIALIISTLFAFGSFNFLTVSVIVGEIGWLRFIYKRKYDSLNDRMSDILAESFFHAAAFCFGTMITLFIFAQTYVANATVADWGKEFFLLIHN